MAGLVAPAARMSCLSSRPCIASRAGLSLTQRVAPIRLQKGVILASDVSEWNVANHMIDNYAKPGMVIGVGRGPITAKFVQLVGAQLKEGTINDVKLLPSNVVTAQEAAFHGVPIAADGDALKIDIMLDEVDEVLAADPSLPVVKFRTSGDVQPDPLQDLVIIAKADEYVAVVDESNVVERLGNWIPVLIDETGWEEIADELDDIWLGDAEIWRRPMRGSQVGANPFGGEMPHLTPEGHTIVDIRFQPGGLPDEPLVAAGMIMGVEGVVAHGLIVGKASKVLVGSDKGVETLVKGA